MLKYLRIAVTALSLAACVLLIVLWVRSYWRGDLLKGYGPAMPALAIDSGSGEVFLAIFGWNEENPTGLTRWQWLPVDAKRQKRGNALGFQFGISPSGPRILMPYWFLVAVAAATGTLPWIRRFSLRTLLIATTLVAVVLGIIVAAR